MASPKLTLTTPPFRLTRHKPTISRHTLDTILETAFSPTSPSRPSTASTTSSFTTAFSTLEAGSPFRYYLPHISTPTSPVYTKREGYACNLAARSPGVRTEQARRFCHYVPRESTEERDVYGEDFEVGTSLRSQEAAEQKAMGELKQFVFGEALVPGEVRGPLEDSARAGVACRSDEEEGGVVDIGSYTAGEKLDTRASALVVGDGKAKKQRGKLTKDQHRRLETVADVSKKVKKMLKRLHLGRKTA